MFTHAFTPLSLPLSLRHPSWRFDLKYSGNLFAHCKYLFLFALLTYIFLCSSAFAANDPISPTIEGLINQICTIIENINQSLQELAHNVLVGLVLISMVLYGASLIFKSSTQFLLVNAYFVKIILVFGCFNYLILNGYQIAQDIINSFIMLPIMRYGTTSIGLTNSFNDFFELVETFSGLFINTQSLIFVVGLALMFVLLSMFLSNFTVNYTTALFVTTIGVITLAFSVFNTTKFMAINYLKLVLGYGLKMFTLYIILIVGQDTLSYIFITMQSQINSNQIVTVQDMGISIFIMYFVYSASQRIPSIMMGLVTK